MSAARSHLAALAAAPRPAGSDAERRAREYCAGVLRGAGFTILERPFEYSTFPGRWGTPISGVVAALMFLAAGHAGAHESPRAALGILLVAAGALGLFASWLARSGVLDLPLARAASTNLVATRGTPSLWLVAHLDSKSQPVPIGVRALAIVALIVVWVAAALIAVAQLVGDVPMSVWVIVTMLGVLAAIPVAATVVGERSPGALDDASGVVTVLRAAELLQPDVAIGVLLTSGEELGLAGARAWARESEPALALNVDGVDDTGGMRLIYSGRFPRALHALIEGSGSAQGDAWPAPRRLMPGLLLDGVALADRGWEVLTISKGNWRTVSRIHTPRDDLSRLDGSGAEQVAAMLARAITANG